jgi:hypothetical protein
MNEYEEVVFLYRLGGGQFALIFGKHHMQLPLGPLIVLPDEGGPERRWGVWPHPGLRTWPPPLACGLLARPGPPPC